MNERKNPMKVPLIRPSMPSLAEYVEEISDIWDSRVLTNMAPKHQKLENELKSYLDAVNIRLFVNGHSALEYILQALDLKGEVITTPFTFASTVHAISRCGLRPVFCDIREDDMTLDASKLEALITEKTSAILPVHVYGMVCDTGATERIAAKYGLKVVYDAAHAFGVTVNGRGIASFGDASIFSFHATKVYHSIEGGAVAFRDEALADRLTAMKDFGITSPETVEFIGGNGKLDEFRAAMGLCNLRHVDEDIRRRKTACGIYDECLSHIKSIYRLPSQPGVERNYPYYPIFLRDGRRARDMLHKELAARGVATRKYFYPLCCDFPCYKDKYAAADVPVARQAADSVLCLPLFGEIKEEEVKYVCDTISHLL